MMAGQNSQECTWVLEGIIKLLNKRTLKYSCFKLLVIGNHNSSRHLNQGLLLFAAEKNLNYYIKIPGK